MLDLAVLLVGAGDLTAQLVDLLDLLQDVQIDVPLVILARQGLKELHLITLGWLLQQLVLVDRVLVLLASQVGEQAGFVVHNLVQDWSQIVGRLLLSLLLNVVHRYLYTQSHRSVLVSSLSQVRPCGRVDVKECLRCGLESSGSQSLLDLASTRLIINVCP